MLYRYFHFYVTIHCPLGKGNHPYKSFNCGLKGTTKQILCVLDNVLNCCCDLCSILVLCHTVNCGRIIPSGTLFLIQLTSWNRLPDWCSWTHFKFNTLITFYSLISVDYCFNQLHPNHVTTRDTSIAQQCYSLVHQLFECFLPFHLFHLVE